MSTNYYVHIPGEPEGSEPIHLGKYSNGWGFTFRAYPERDITDYETWVGQLGLGEIRDEYGAVITVREMIYAAQRRPDRPHPAPSGGLVDHYGYRFIAREFC
jgi:hypothetical protein